MTLIELLIVVAISAIIMIALLSLYMAGQKYFFNQNSRADTIEESRMPMAWVSRDIRGAQNIVNGPIDAFNGIQYRSDADTLILEVPDIPNPGGMSYIIYDYDMTHHRLMRIVDQQTGSLQNRTRVMADNLIDDGSGGSPFKLKYFRSDGTTEVTSGYADATNGAFIVEVELTAQGRSIQRGSQPFVETVRTQAKLRNKVIPVIPS
jgi:hypothetical protein